MRVLLVPHVEDWISSLRKVRSLMVGENPLSGGGFETLTSLVTGSVSANKTSSPILFIGKTLDPVTPLHSAMKVCSQFSGSAVLTVDGPPGVGLLPFAPFRRKLTCCCQHTSRRVPSERTWKHFVLTWLMRHFRRLIRSAKLTRSRSLLGLVRMDLECSG